MTAQATAAPLSPASSPRTVRRRRLALLVVLLVAVVAAVLLALRGGNGGSGPAAELVAVDELPAVAADAGHAVFWVGPPADASLELTHTSDGRVFLRYLPDGAEAGDPNADYVSVGTYPQADALATLKATARRQGRPTTAIAGGGLAFQDAERPTSAYAAYPGVDLQIEVFDPRPGRALQLIESGALAAAAKPAAGTATVADLQTLSDRLGHPLYWAGADPSSSLELTRTTDGRVYVRYLPAGAEAGATGTRHLTVGTYPQEDALETLRATAERAGSTPIALPGGGLGYVDADRPTSAYAAFPGSDLQIVVFTPRAQRTRELLLSGRIVPVSP